MEEAISPARPTDAAKEPTDLSTESLDLHRKYKGKIQVSPTVPLETTDDLGRAYTPGVASVCEAVGADPSARFDLTVAGNSVAVVTDGSAVLGLGDIGPAAALPVMEGKAALFRRLAEVDAWPICLDQREPDAIIETIRALSPGFAGINLEDIAAPRCFEIEARLQDLGIPVFHDDQHGTAIVLLAGLINAVRITGKSWSDLRIVISGAGAAGRAITRLLSCSDHASGGCNAVGEIIVCDSKGAIHSGRDDLTPTKEAIAARSNPHQKTGILREVLPEADVFVGVSRGGLLDSDDIRTMAPDPLVFALANPDPEIDPGEAHKGGAAVVATGRSDYPNQVNNVLVFPGIFRGALDARAPRITDAMKLAAARAIADVIENPSPTHILPGALDPRVAPAVAKAVAGCARKKSKE